MDARPEGKIETHFEETGSLPTPRVVGRIVRLFLGVWLLYALYALLRGGWGVLVDQTAPRYWEWWAFIALAFWVTPYVVNIGFTRNWKRRPQVAVASVAAVAIVLDLAIYGTWWAPPLGAFVWVWLVYFSAHLGFSFVLSTILGTPGCEMRAIPHLWSRITGRDTKEHYCPGPLDNIDRWEADKSGSAGG